MEIRNVDEARILLRSVRKSLGLSSQEAADLSGVSRSTLNRAEIGPEDVKLSAVLKLLAAYGLEMDIRPIQGGDRDG